MSLQVRALTRAAHRLHLIRSARCGIHGAAATTDNFDWLCSDKLVVPNSSVELGRCNVRMGHLTESSVLGRAGGSVVHVALASKTPEEEPKEDFLPLTVDYRSRAYALKYVPDLRKRRERHGEDDEVLVARFIDRAVRPLFPSGFVNEVQLTVTAHAVDPCNDPTVLALNATSLALMQSKQPWNGPIGCVRVGLINDKLVVNPSFEDMKSSTLDLLYAGTMERALMIEAGGKQIPEQVMTDAIHQAHSAVRTIIQAQNDFLAKSSSSSVVAAPLNKLRGVTLSEQQKEALTARFLDEAISVYRSMNDAKEDRAQLEGAFMERVKSFLANDAEWSAQSPLLHSMAADYITHTAFRAVTLESDATPQARRVDGRSPTELRPIACKKEVLPTVHGSAYFSRGDTHTLCTTTLASCDFARTTIPLNGDGKEVLEHFMLHYDFPPYATGELGSVTASNRRITGHGNLAEKALKFVMPPLSTFPYTVRVFSECVSSNGSSSMAAVCGGTLALVDAGVPIKDLVAGISVGLVTDASFAEQCETSASKYVLLKDINGSEDHNGDMDFKVAGTVNGITAIQLDVKLAGGVPLPLLVQALHLAREGRLEVLQSMKAAVEKNPRTGLRPSAPAACMVPVDAKRLDLLVGPRGETLKFLETAFDVHIDIRNEDSTVYIYGSDAEKVQEAKHCVEDIAVQMKEKTVVDATVLEVLDHGCIVRINRAGSGLLHVLDVSHDAEVIKRPMNTIFKQGHRFKALIHEVDDMTGSVKLSRKALLDHQQPDTLSDLVLLQSDSMTNMILREVPKFPLQPPRPFNKEFFNMNVVANNVAQKAMNGPPQSSSTGSHGARPHRGANTPRSANSSSPHKSQGGSYTPSHKRQDSKHSKHSPTSSPHSSEQRTQPHNQQSPK